MTEVKTHNITVTVTDNTFSSTHYIFQITVTNLPPRVNSTIQSPVSVQFGQSLIYNLPYSIDPEGLNFTTTVQSGPSFA